MKNIKLNKFLASIFFVCISLFSYCGFANENQDANFKNEKQWNLKIGETKYPALFEDNDGYSDDFLDEVVADIQLIYARYPEDTLRILDEKEKFFVKNNEITSKKRITPPEFWPKEFTDNHLYMAQLNIKDHIIIRSGLLKGYKKAIKLKKRNFKKFKKLYEFIDYFNNIGDHINPEKLLELYDFRFAPSPQIMRSKAIIEFNNYKNKNPVKQYKMFLPSILEVNKSDDDIIKGYFFYHAVCFDKKYNEVNKVFPLVYLDNKWKIIIVPIGT